LVARAFSHVKAAHKHVDEIDHRGEFQQHVYAKLLHSQIPKAQKDSQVINVFLCFWDLYPKKLLIKHW